jgi:putative hydrolase of the HAD superfamily
MRHALESFETNLPSLPNPTAILFDLDDTLHDRRASVKAFAPALHAHLEPWLSGMNLETFSQHLHRVDHGGYVAREVFFTRLLGSLGATGFDAQQLAAFWRSEFAKFAQPMQGAYALLKFLRGQNIKTAIVSNGSSQLQRNKIAALNLRVDVVIISEEVGVKKPAPLPFLSALKLLEVVASRAWFVGDHPVNDIEGANAVGMKTFWLEREQSGVDVQAVKIESLFDLQEWIKEPWELP